MVWDKSKYEYPQTAQTLYACQQTRAAINISMLMTTEMAVLAKHLIFNKLQNESFLLAKCAVLQVKTGRIAVRNGTYGNSRRQKLFFSCISASMGRLRIFKKAKIKLNKKELHSKRVVSTPEVQFFFIQLHFPTPQSVYRSQTE